ncbi:cellobiose phosphorylase [Anaeroplasma bactoclasticum]|jgi:cellobiose phosphorylase|uniref:Cellobiose phosphorylase n=1 Tax=Anaeroplasma bactoclasticum TaxID=2088 RepID=A0A397RQB0_9MOLU|nr:glycosyl transferase [Anaeroplasma bactoclasticum]RIA75898.1 cellobiose phosphorylase [Anaeroplasma bactoclasticum]
MKFGHFDDNLYEYVITNYNTPLPWINYFGQDGFFSLMSNTCGGYMFYRDAKLRRITRFRYNNVPRDYGGRYYYINDGGTIWNPGFLPLKTKLDSYKCRHGLGYSIFESEKNNLKCELLAFVPLNDLCEINQITLTNNSNEVKNVTLHGVVEWCLWNAVDDSTNFQRNWNIGEVEVDDKTIYHKTEYRERRNHYSFFHTNIPHDGFDSDLDTFMGLYNSWCDPNAVLEAKSYNSMASGWAPIGCHMFKIELKPGESKTIIFQTGYVENEDDKKFSAPGVINKEKAYELQEKYATPAQVEKAFTALKNKWVNLLSTLHVESDNKKFDRMVNIWNQYQCMVTFNMSRSASYYESGTGRGMGFRDSCQDLLGFLHLIPEKSKERIIDIASIQFQDGSTYHQYQPLTKRGNADIGGGFNDDPLWLIAAVSQYIKETGDYTILDTPTPFNNEAGSEKPLLDHLRASFNYITTHKGPHGLPLIGRADWNDCLNLNCFSKTPGESFQTASNFESGKAESVFIAGMYVLYGKEFAEILRRSNHKNEADIVLKEVKAVEEATIKYGWDGEWFVRAYDAFCNKVGSHECEDGQIFVEPQGFCTMARIGEDLDFGKKALDSVEKHLTNDYGVEILHPCYKEYHIELGEVSSYPMGYKENGSVFCHNNPWIVIANTVIGNNERAFDIYKRNCPAYLEEVSEIHKTEPYCYSQTIAGRDAKNYGEAKNSWLTGTASWTMVAASQAILGIVPDYDGLKIDPHLPKEIKHAEVQRVFRGITYNITINNNATGKYQMVVNGKPVDGKVVPFDKTQTQLKVVIDL